MQRSLMQTVISPNHLGVQSWRSKSREYRRSTRPSLMSPSPGASYRRSVSTSVPRPSSQGGYSLVRKEGMIPRYPNYLPEMKARRAGSSNKHPRARSYSANSSTINDQILRELMNLVDVRTKLSPFPPFPRVIFSTSGHPLFIPPDRMARRYPEAVLSLYRTPTKKVLEWETGSPTLQLENMRLGGCVGPSPSQLPSPDSSHSVLLSMRGRNRSHRVSQGAKASSYRRQQ